MTQHATKLASNLQEKLELCIILCIPNYKKASAGPQAPELKWRVRIWCSHNIRRWCRPLGCRRGWLLTSSAREYHGLHFKLLGQYALPSDIEILASRPVEHGVNIGGRPYNKTGMGSWLSRRLHLHVNCFQAVPEHAVQKLSHSSNEDIPFFRYLCFSRIAWLIKA